MKFFILTDLEGVVGVDSFTQTRTSDVVQKGPAMRQLAREVNSCIEGIRSLHPDAQIDVWDGHGSGGLHREDLVGGNYLRPGKPYNDLRGYAAHLFVGQHAMAGTIFAPLAHTYSSLNIAYYRLNGIFIGEFGCRALIAGRQGVPTIFLAGDDKAAAEARMFIPEIETAIVKQGTGFESARHIDADEAFALIRQGTINALKRMHEIPPFTGIEPPYTLEIRYNNPQKREKWQGDHVTWLDDRTVQIRGDDLSPFPF